MASEANCKDYHDYTIKINVKKKLWEWYVESFVQESLLP